jgi:hypothetical protein
MRQAFSTRTIHRARQSEISLRQVENAFLSPLRIHARIPAVTGESKSDTDYLAIDCLS